MGLAEDHAAYLRLYLYNGTKPTQAQYKKSKKHQIPTRFTAGGSMNWWVLAVGVRMAYGDLSEAEAAAQQLEKERNEIGTWGSEQHSPIYWSFHMLGRLSMLKNCQHDRLKALIKSQLADWFVYCNLAMSPDKKQVLYAGMRGTGMPQFTSHELWWLYKTHIEKGNPPKLRYWTRNNGPLQYGWMWAPTATLHLGSLQAMVFDKLSHRSVDGIRSPTHFMTFAGGDKWVYTEDDQHSSTAFRGGGGVIHGKEVAAPANYRIHKRGSGASGEVDTQVGEGTLRIDYFGPYNSLPGAKPLVYFGPIGSLLEHYIWDSGGLRDARNESTVQAAREFKDPAPMGWFEKLKLRLVDIFS